MIVGSAEVLITPTSRGFAEALEADLTPAATGVAKKLSGIIVGALSVREVGQFFKSTVDAASDTVESVNKVATVFGESADEVERFAESADVLGLANQQALEAAGGFGNLFSAMGLADEKSAEMSTRLAGLAGDLASFQNTSVEEALQALTSGIVGETEPLRKYAVTINEGRIQQEALAQGLTDGTGALDAQTKALAIYGLIMQDTANAQGDALKTGGDLAGQQRQLTAEWSNAKAEIGAGLLPAVLEMVEATRGDLVPTVVELAESAVPLLIEGFQAAEPLMGTTTSILQAMAPTLETVADIIDAIPDPLLEVGAYTLVASRGLNLAATAAGGLATRATDFAAIDFSGRLDDSGRSAGVAASGFSKLNVAVGLATLAVGAGVSIYNDATESAREYAGQVDEIALSMESVVSGQRDVNESIDEFLAKRELSDEALSALDTILGPDAFGQIRDAIRAGGDALDPFRESIRQIGVDLEGLDVGQLDNPDSDRGHIPRLVAEAYGIERSALQDLIDAIEDYDQAQQDGARSTLDTFIRTGELTQRQVDTAAAQAGLTEEGTNWVEVASILGGRVAEVVGVTDEMGRSASEARPSLTDLNEALEAQRDRLAEVNSEMSDLIDAQFAAFDADLGYDKAVADLTDALGDYETAAKEAADAAAGRGPADVAVLDTMKEVRDAELDLADAQREFGSGSKEAQEASERLADTRRDLADAEASASKEGVDAARNLRDAMFDLRGEADERAKTALAIAEADAEAAGKTLDWKDKNDILRAELMNTLHDIGPDSPLRGELINLVNDLNDVPGVYVATAVLEAQDAIHDLAELNAGLQAFVEVTTGTLDLRGPNNANATLGFLGAADGFSGTVNRPTMFLTGEGGEPEDVLVVPQSLGGVPKVVAQFAAALQGAGPFVGGRTVTVEQHFHIHETTSAHSTAMQVAKRMRGGGFRGGISGLVD